VSLFDGSNNNLIVPTSPGSRTPSFAFGAQGDSATIAPYSFSLLHSPATTSSFTYKVKGYATSGTFLLNRSQADENIAARGRNVSTITLMEVAG